MPRTIPTAEPSESEWQATVVATMHALGWRHNFTRRTIGRGKHWTTATSCVGWPDLTAWHEGQKRLIFVEVKAEKGALTDEQDAVLASLETAGQAVYVWRPSDYEWAVRVLKGDV